MINMIKILAAVIILLAFIDLGILGKKALRALIFRTAKTQSPESLVLEWVTGLLVIGLSLAYYLKQQPQTDLTMWAGVIVFFAGAILQLIARRQLYEEKTFEERLMSGFSAAQVGLYARIRHPSKAALLLMMIGLCFALGSLWAFAVLVFLFIPSMLYRISQEERALQDKFGERWIEYKEDTKRIIPGVF